MTGKNAVVAASKLHAYFGKDPYGGFSGLAKHFNTTTNWGRYNIARVTLGSEAFIGFYFYLKSKWGSRKTIQK